MSSEAPATLPKRPFSLKFRSSVGFCTAVVLLSVFVDIFTYALIIPVIPFRLEELGYKSPAALAGWLLFAFSFGLIATTPPLAYLAERYWSRRAPLLIAVLLLIGSQALFMEANVYWLMVLARVIQGASSAVVWMLSFALLCDTVPEEIIARQLGIVMMGMTLGLLVAPPIGGIMSEKLGYRSPFILSMSVCAFDFIGRLLIIEKDEAAKWAEDTSPEVRQEANPDTASVKSRERSQLSPLKVLGQLLRSKRASIAILNGTVLTMLEPTLPLRLQDLYGYTSFKVGIIFLACTVPSLISTPLAGWATDKIGVEWVIVAYLVCSIPFWPLLAIKGSISLLATSLAFAYLAAIARESEGIGYAHTFGAFNLAYSGSNAIGPVIGGQLYTHVGKGWSAIAYLSCGLIILAAMAAFYGSGSRPLLGRLIEVLYKNAADGEPDMVMGPVPAESTERSASLHSQHQGSIGNATHGEIIVEANVKQA
ncbi:MFS general substrate transporter [Serendipita vermifera]|nr:MFS general substrate transporter [Serendipita vermifera]